MITVSASGAVDMALSIMGQPNMPYIGNELAAQFQAFETQTITGDGSTQDIRLMNRNRNGKELLVYINNVKQEEGSDKSLYSVWYDKLRPMKL